MNRFDSPTVLLRRRNNSRSAASDAAGQFCWEEIMVQITFAFLIILGYLLSSKAEDASDLGNKVREQEEKWRQQTQRSKLLEKLVQEMRHTELGEARAGRVAAEKQLQLEKLFRVWAELRNERRLYRLLRRFENAEAIPLDDVSCLPTGEAFAELNRESSRVFLASGENLSLDEISGLMTTVLECAGFDTKVTIRSVDPGLFTAEASQLYLDTSVPTRENLKMLKSRVVTDLEAERRELFRLQCAAHRPDCRGAARQARRDSPSA